MVWRPVLFACEQQAAFFIQSGNLQRARRGEIELGMLPVVAFTERRFAVSPQSQIQSQGASRAPVVLAGCCIVQTTFARISGDKRTWSLSVVINRASRSKDSFIR